ELLIKADLQSWLHNPVLGVGAGMGGPERLKYFDVPTAHTEYTRLLGEHGIAGLLALVVMGVMSLNNLRRQPTRLGKAISAAFLAYALLFMAVNAMRLAAVSFVFGLSGVTVTLRRKTSRER